MSGFRCTWLLLAGCCIARGTADTNAPILTLQQARDLGSAMGCDFYFVGEAQTVKRSPSTGQDYYESYATVFLVSARTGRLILWERPTIQRERPEESEKALLAKLSSEETRQRYINAIRRAVEEERAAAQLHQLPCGGHSERQSSCT